MRRNIVTPLRVGLAGIALIVGEMVWSAYQDYRAAQALPWLKGGAYHVYPGIFAIHIAQLGFLLCFVAFIWASIRGGWSIFSRRRRKMPKMPG